MFRRIILFIGMVFLLCGCNAVIPVSEVLQQPQGGKIYTRYNMWYTNPAQVSSLNIQEGRILHAGSEVTAVSADEEKLVIADRNGQQYTIVLDHGLLMCSMREFIRNFLTLDKPEVIFSKVDKKYLPYVKRGEAVPGMTRSDILIAYGPPPACRTPNLKNETWVYWISRSETIRVIFRNEKVRNIINPKE